VLVQTRDPEHPCLQAVRTHDHAQLCAVELELRQMLGYPPFTYAAQLRLDGRNPAQVEGAAGHLAERLEAAGASSEGSRLRGPAPAPLERLRGRTRWSLLLTADSRAALHRLLEVVVEAGPPSGDLRLIMDVDPYDFL
jgi:primosomal protein N' (replication factor Y)